MSDSSIRTFLTAQPSIARRRRESPRGPRGWIAILAALFALITACASTSSSSNRYAAFEAHRFT
jgi:hypothetical protein